MVRHVCGTCRFFRTDDRNRKSGECGHPQRQTTTDVHILVRAGELNCRNDWDHHLWQLREDGDRVLDVSMAKPQDHSDRPGGPERVERRRTLGEDTPQVGTPLPPAADVVIGVDLNAPRLVSEDINREMIRRAREDFRARRQVTRPGGPSPRIGEGSTPPALHRPEPIIISNDVQPHQIGMLPGPDLTRISDRDRSPVPDRIRSEEPSGGAFSTVPDRTGAVDLPLRAAPRPDVRRSVDDFDLETFRTLGGDVDDSASNPSRDSNIRYADSAAHRNRDRLDRYTEPATSWSGDSSDHDDESETNRSEGDLDRLVYVQDWPVNEAVDEPRAGEPEDEESFDSASTTAEDHDGRRQGGPEEIRPWSYVEPRRSRPSEMVARGSGRLASPSMSRLWDAIPRCCRTCRDFRAAESGGSGGWCTNRWAFRHRRMVDVDQLTCETTIGDWWLPSDEAWQDDFDVGRHALSTPLMDKWFGRPEEESDAYYPMVASRTRRRH